MPTEDQELIRYALIGLEQHKQNIQEIINELRAKLGSSKTKTASASSVPRRRNRMSEIGRERIAAAQRLRWATRKSLLSTATPNIGTGEKPEKKWTFSLEARARMAQGQRKRWARTKKTAD